MIPPKQNDTSLRERLLKLRRPKVSTRESQASFLANSIATQNFDSYESSRGTESGRSSIFGFLNSSFNTSSYNWIPVAILSAIVLFFVVIFSVYCYSRLNFASVKDLPDVANVPDPSDADSNFIAQLKIPLCSDTLSSKDASKRDNVDCFTSRSSVKPALKVIQELGQMFESRLIRYHCGGNEVNDLPPDPTIISLAEIKDHLYNQVGQLEKFKDVHKEVAGEDVTSSKAIHDAIRDAITLIKLNPKLRIGLIENRIVQEVAAFRVDAKFPVKWPAMCGLKRALIDALWKCVIVLVIILASTSCYYYLGIKKRRQSDEEVAFYELVEKALELLQSPDEPRSMPVLHIRDTLISVQERKNAKLMAVWEKVVSFVETTDSRVKIEIENIDGEVFRTWKWVSSSAPDGSSPSANVLRTGNIEWQGQAFSDQNPEMLSGSRRTPTRSNENFTAPTPFLKVRHMFDAEAAILSPSTWKNDVSEAILQKCSVHSENGTHGILHLVIDERDMAEGLVYMRCKDIKSASHVFSALHGWWCEKRLVSVRFLKEERYFSRFPEARVATEPLSVQGVAQIVDDQD